MTVGAALGIVGAALGISALVMFGVTRSVEPVSPLGVLRRLRSARNDYTVRVPSTRGAWNPAGQAGNYRLSGPGAATYRLDTSPEGEVIHLTFTPTSGSPQHVSAPVSDRLRLMADRTGFAQWRNSALPIGLTQVALAGLGVAVALIVTSGRSNDARVVGVFIGFFSGIMMPMVALIFFAFGHAVVTTMRRDLG